MKKMRNIATLLLFLALSFSAVAQNSLAVYLNDGTSASFSIEEQPKITFSGEIFNITSANATMDFSRADVKNFKFEERTSTAVETPTTGSATVTDDGIRIDGLSQNSSVALYNIAGKVLQTITATDGSCTISLKELPSGIYLINYNNKTIKYIKK